MASTSTNTPDNYLTQYKESEIYTSKTIIKYDEYGNVISKDILYDKEIKYAPKTMTNTYYNHHQLYNQPAQSVNSTPTSSVPTSPTSLDSVSIDMSTIGMYNYY